PFWSKGPSGRDWAQVLPRRAPGRFDGFQRRSPWRARGWLLRPEPAGLRATPSQGSRWRPRRGGRACRISLLMTTWSWKILIFKAVWRLGQQGLFGAARHSPNRGALATRKVCQNDEILDR